MEQTDKKISQMPPLQNVSGDEIVPVVKSGGNYSVLVSQIVALARQTMVEAQAGKGLSANDFTDALKAKLEGLSSYDDTEVRSLITAINGRLDTILGDGASTAIDTFNEIEAFLTGITDTQTLTGLLAEQKQTITTETDNKLAGKVDKVSGKGLSANDYTDDEKAKLGALPSNEQFGLVGYYNKNTGAYVNDVLYRTSGLLALNRNYDLNYKTSVGGNALSIAFFAADGTWLGGQQIGGSIASTIKADDFPTNAVYFAACTESKNIRYSSYRNGPTQESREGAMAEALASLGRDKLDKEKWDAEHGQFGLSGYISPNFTVVQNTSFKRSGLLPLDRNSDIVATVAGSNIAAIALYDAAGTGLANKSAKYDSTSYPMTWPSEEFPDNAVFFQVSTIIRDGINYTNGPSIESREGAVSEAIQAAMTAAVDEALIAEATAAGAIFNRTSGYFELNTLTDITAEQMRKIMAAGARQSSTLPWAYILSTIRTHLPRVGIGQAANAVSTFRSCSFLETVDMPNMILQGDVFFNCKQLRSVNWKGIPIYNLNNTANANFQGCSKLVELRGSLRNNFDFNIADSPLLSLASFQYMVDYAYNTAPITVIVHPTVYGKLTDEQADIMALLPENLLTGPFSLLVKVNAIDNGVEATAPGFYFQIGVSPRLLGTSGGKLTLSCDVEGLQDGESVALLVGSSTEPRPTWTISANGRAVFSFNFDSHFKINNSDALLIYDAGGTYTGHGLKLTNFKLSYGEYDELPYTAPLSSITDDATREKAEWLSLMQIAEARQINFVTTE